MKKVIIVLLITVLVAGFAFAGTFTGFARIEFGVDLDENEWGFKNTTFGKYTFKFGVDTASVKIGEDHQTDVWAELAAEAEAYIQLTAGTGNLAASAANITPGAKYTAKITTANIHVGEITFGILNAGSAANFAKSYYDDNNDGSADYDVVKENGTAPGFTVSYKDWKGGFGAQGTWDEDDSDLNTYKIFAHVETPTFKFADDAVTVNAGAYAFLTDKNTFIAGNGYTNFGGGAKAAYAADKFSASLAADLQLISRPETALTEKETKFAFEVAANATYDFVSLDLYVAPGAFFGALGYTDDDPIKLDAMVSAAYTFDLTDDVALDVDGYVEVRDALIKGMALYVGSSQATTVKAFTFSLSEDLEIDNLANSDVDVAILLDLGAKVTYTHEKFVAYCKLNTSFDFSADEALYALGVEAGISSEAIVEGAKLALVYKNAAANKIAFKDTKGSVTASCTISF